MAPSFRVIAHEAKQSQSATRLAEIASSRFALLAMTAFSLALIAPASAADGDIDQGRDTYQEVCATCHGPDMVNSGTLSPDLRKFPRDDFVRFKRTVLNGKGSAMPAWAGKLSDEDVANLWAYVATGG
jgi:mono/diheme cytochrome c family protein